MSAGYRYSKDLNCLFVRFGGELTPSDFAAVIGHAVADPAVPARHLRFTDLRSVTAGPGTAELEEMAKRGDAGEERKAAIRHALLVDGNAPFGFARVYRAHRDQGQEALNVFRDYKRALAWLGLPADLTDPFADERWQPDWSTAAE